MARYGRGKERGHLRLVTKYIPEFRYTLLNAAEDELMKMIAIGLTQIVSADKKQGLLTQVLSTREEFQKLHDSIIRNEDHRLPPEHSMELQMYKSRASIGIRTCQVIIDSLQTS